MKILLVEDSATLRHTLSRFIEKARHKVAVAKSGEEALQLIENEAFDLIIMDVEMPGLNGFETTRLMREWFGEHWVPIIFVTGKTDDASCQEGIDAGGDDYLAKPVSEVILNAKIRAMERIITMRDQLNKLNLELAALSQRDSLTQLFNRRTFDDLAQQQWASLKRRQLPASILMLDVDHFKQYNDCYGHPAGDVCLQQVAEVLQDCIHRADDIVARYGGEEFIVFLPDTDLNGAITVGERILQDVTGRKIPHEKSTTGKVVSVSIGVANSQFTGSMSLSQLQALADKALYEAKRGGRNRLHTEEASPHKTVLIADDDPYSLHCISEALRDRCNIVTTESGLECMEFARRLRPDLILLDVRIPEVDGGKLWKFLKSHQDTTNIPVVLIAANKHDPSFLAWSNHANACLHKPIVAEDLLSRVSQFLN